MEQLHKDEYISHWFSFSIGVLSYIEVLIKFGE